MEVGLPARHVRPRRPDAPDPAAGRPRARRRLAGRALGDHQDRLLVGGARRVDRAGRVPPGRLQQRGGAARRRQGPGAPGRGPRAGDRLLPPRRTAAHERLGPPARPSPGSAGWSPRPTPSRTTTVFEITSLPSTWPPRPPRGSSAGRASCAREPGPTCSWASPPTGSTSSGRRPVTERAARAPGRALRRPLPARRTLAGPAPRAGLAARWCATPPTTRSAPARSTRWSTPSSTATPRPARSPRGWPAGPWRALARSMAEPGPVVVNPVGPGPRRAWSSWWWRPTSLPGADVQVLSERFGLPGSMTLDADDRAHHPRHAPGAQDRQRRLGPGRPGRGGRHRHRPHGRRRPRGAARTSPSPR